MLKGVKNDTTGELHRLGFIVFEFEKKDMMNVKIKLKKYLMNKNIKNLLRNLRKISYFSLSRFKNNIYCLENLKKKVGGVLENGHFLKCPKLKNQNTF